MSILCPPDLNPDVIIRRDDPCFQVGYLDTRDYIRARMSVEEIEAEIDAISALGYARMSFGDFNGLGLKPNDTGYACVDSGVSVLTWLHSHERKRIQLLKEALPTSAEAAVLARARIQARLAARRGHVGTAAIALLAQTVQGSLF